MRRSLFLICALALAYACSEENLEQTQPSVPELVTTLSGGIDLPAEPSMSNDGTRVTIVYGSDAFHKQILWDTDATGDRGADRIYVRSDKMTSGYALFRATATSDDRLSATFTYQQGSSYVPLESGFTELFAGMFAGAIASVPYDSNGVMWINMFGNPVHADDGTIDKDFFPLVGYAQGSNDTGLHFRVPFGVLHIVLTAEASDPVKLRQTRLALDPAVKPGAYLKGGMMVNARDAVSPSGNFTFTFASTNDTDDLNIVPQQDKSYLLPTDMVSTAYRFIMPAGDYPARSLQFTVWEDDGGGGLGASKTWTLGNALTVESSHTYTLPPLVLTTAVFE